MPNVLKFELKLLMMITTVYAYDNSYKTSITKKKSFQSLESDRIHKPSLYNKEFDRRTADVISGSLPLLPLVGQEREHHSTLCDHGVSSYFDLYISRAPIWNEHYSIDSRKEG
jgi:hypothetical protein